MKVDVRLVFIIPLFLIGALRAPAQSSTPYEAGWVTDGAADAIVYSAGTIYLGGTFNYIGPVGGAGGQTRHNLAALDAATCAPTAWNPDADSSIIDLVVSGSTVYVGGYFMNIGGQSRNHIAALDAATGVPTAWNPNANGIVCALAVSDSTVYAGGIFSNIGGQARNFLAALDAVTGIPTAWDPNVMGSINTLCVSGSTVYVGGQFNKVGGQREGQTRNNLAALDAATGAPTAWNPNVSPTGPDNGVFAMAVTSNTLYIGGEFSSVGGQARNNLAALDILTGAPTAWNPSMTGEGSNFAVATLAVSGGKIYVGGAFTVIRGQITQNFVAAFDTTGQLLSWNPNLSGRWVDALSVTNSAVFIGGFFDTVNGQSRPNFARFDFTPVPVELSRFTVD